MLNSKCLICGNFNTKKIRCMNILSRYTLKSYPLYRCLSCGLIRPDQKSIKEMLSTPIYDDPKNIKFYDNKNSIIDEDSNEYKYYFKHFAVYLDLVKKYNIHGKGLDIGCGAGHLIKTLSKYGITMEGSDISTTLALALKKQGIKVHIGELNKINLKNKYDLITFNQVLEHVNNPREFIEDTKKLLNAKGYIIFAVLYLFGLVPQLLRSYWYGLGYGQHINLFSKKSLNILLKESGFEICELDVTMSEYAHPKFPRVLNLAIGIFMNLLLKLNLGDNLFIVARLNKK